ncbi:MAG TPA: M56 family metallopeptidase, partial [Gemmatimonadales bacterium]|nr:M56 family metallopeptidase [Gemmatimonadales bacterium]
MACWLRLLGGWIRAVRLRSRFVRPASAEWQQAFDRLKTRIRVSLPVRLVVSSLVQAPAVVGWLRPVVLMPVGALTGLPLDHIEALLLHELAHIRRHDYLVNVLQSMVETLLFYHPAVWWISGHIRTERELCCDDAAVSVTGDVLTYARALAGLESARPTNLNPVMAASGGSLAHRIARLLGQSRPVPRTLAGPAIVTVAMLLAVTALAVFGQPVARPKFEAASIKTSEETNFRMVRPLPGRLTADATVRLLVQNAYTVQPFQVVGGPAWIDAEQYEIEAKADGSANRAQMFLMLQSLLEDRFQLKTHRETRELPVYALVPARSGPKLPLPKDGS